MLPEEDVVRLRHMLDGARDALDFSNGRKRQDLDADKMLVFALIHAVEVIGEAAAQVTAETKAACPHLAWPKMIAMRNRLIHAYYDINLDRLWDTTTEDLPALVAELERLLAPE
jgi:uncharacterized protein with HEPN domain